MIGELFPWTEDSCLCYPMNSHTSLLGLRSFAPESYSVPSALFQHDGVPTRESNTTTMATTDSLTPTTTPTPAPTPILPLLSPSGSKEEGQGRQTFNLLVVPGECNFSGRKVIRNDTGAAPPSPKRKYGRYKSNSRFIQESKPTSGAFSKRQRNFVKAQKTRQSFFCGGF